MPLEALRHDTDSKDPNDRKKVMIFADDGLRKGTTKEGLAKVRSAFPQFPPGQTTGGNASQITDGAAVCLLMKVSLCAFLCRNFQLTMFAAIQSVSSVFHILLHF